MDPRQALDERQQQILQAIVHTYITTAEPVGSRLIVKRYNLKLSPATVRNVMADLEESGFLEQVHTSSGRIPTSLGYRYYIDYLMQIQELTATERAQIEHELTAKLNDVDSIMRQTSQLLALVTHQAGIVEAPDKAHAAVRRIELLPLDPLRFAVLIVDSIGRVTTMMAQWTGSTPLHDVNVNKLNNFMNAQLLGAPVSDLRSTLQSRMQHFVDEQRQLAEQSLSVLNLLPSQRPERLFLEGTTQLFEQPEFRDIARARGVFTLLEEQGALVELLRAGMREGEPRASVLIGAEALQEGLEDISVVASPYRVGGQTVGMIGVLGPRRMPYSRLSAVVEYTASTLGRFLTRLAG